MHICKWEGDIFVGKLETLNDLIFSIALHSMTPVIGSEKQILVSILYERILESL